MESGKARTTRGRHARPALRRCVLRASPPSFCLFVLYQPKQNITSRPREATDYRKGKRETDDHHTSI